MDLKSQDMGKDMSMSETGENTGTSRDVLASMCSAASTWSKLKENAEVVFLSEVAIQTLLTSHILTHDNLGSAAAYLLASDLSCSELSAESWTAILGPYFTENNVYDDSWGPVLKLIAFDLEAILARDPAAYDYVSSFLYFKGFKAILSHRAAHMLWKDNRKLLALKVQSACSQRCAVDIHPGAVIGPGILLDHVRTTFNLSMWREYSKNITYALLLTPWTGDGGCDW